MLNLRRLPAIYALLLAGLIVVSLFRYRRLAPPAPQIAGNSGYRELWNGDVSASVVRFEQAVSAEPAFPYRWSDLGEAYAAQGKNAQALRFFRRAVALAPYSAQIGLRAANFYFANGMPEEGLALDAKILIETPELDQAIFRTYARFGGPLDRVLNVGIGTNARAAATYFLFLLSSNAGPRPDEKVQLQRIWAWLEARNYISVDLARAWADWLLKAGSPAEAAQTWGNRVAVDPNVYRKSNWIDNGGFEVRPLAAGAFDWTSNPMPAVTVSIDDKVAHQGTHSLRLTLDSQDNLDYHQYSQRIWLETGTYIVEGWVRTNALSTDQGIGLEIVDPALPAKLDACTPAVTSTHDWTQVSATFTVSGIPRLAELRVVRRRSLDFDNHPHGTAWLDDIAIRRLR